MDIVFWILLKLFNDLINNMGGQALRKELEKPLKTVADVSGYCPETTCKKYGLSSDNLNKYNIMKYI